MPNGYNILDGGGGGDRISKPVKVSLKESLTARKILKLGEYLKKYRKEHEMTMQEMADACGFSKAYISLLEKGINSTTNKPFSPTLQALNKIARATKQAFDSLLKRLDGEQLVTVKPADYTFSKEEKELLNGFNSLSADGKNTLMTMLKSLCVTHSAAI